MKGVGDMYKRYMKYGSDMEIFHNDISTKLKDIPSDYITKRVDEIISFKKKFGHDNDDYFNDMIFIYSDTLQKRRFDKIKQIKDNIKLC